MVAYKNAVVVSLNFRLALFGFLALSELSRESNGVSGNQAIGDIINALKWVNNKCVVRMYVKFCSIDIHIFTTGATRDWEFWR